MVEGQTVCTCKPVVFYSKTTRTTHHLPTSPFHRPLSGKVQDNQRRPVSPTKGHRPDLLLVGPQLKLSSTWGGILLESSWSSPSYQVYRFPQTKPTSPDLYRICRKLQHCSQKIQKKFFGGNHNSTQQGLVYIFWHFPRTRSQGSLVSLSLHKSNQARY